MLSTVKVTPAMFPEVYEAVLRDLRDDMPVDVWRRAFDGRWTTVEDYCGYALADGSKIVGFLGLLFSERPVRGRVERFCNLHAWRVHDDYRAKGLALLKPIRDLKHHTLTDFTASRDVGEINERLGFVKLPSNIFVLLPLPFSTRRSRADVHALTAGDDPRGQELSDSDRRILADHSDIECGHLLLNAGAEYCYVVYSRIATHRLPYCLVHYVSNPRLFAVEHQTIRRHLLQRCRAAFAIVEQPLMLGEKIPFALRSTAQTKYYRSNTVAPDEVDTLYSEVALHKHSLLPGLRRRIREMIHDYLPARVRNYVPAPRPT